MSYYGKNLKWVSTLASLWLILSCDGGGGGSSAGGNSSGAGSIGDFRSCMISSPKGNAANEYNTMCFNIPEDVTSNICVDGALGVSGNSSSQDDDSNFDSDSSSSSTSNGQTPDNSSGNSSAQGNSNGQQQVEDDNSGSSLSLNDAPGNSQSSSQRDSGKALLYRLNANYCQIITPIASACSTKVGGFPVSVYFSALDTDESEANQLCNSPLQGTLKDIDPGAIQDINTNPNPNIDTNSNGNGNGNNSNTNGSKVDASGLAASLAGKVKDCGDSTTESQYCGSGKLGEGPRFTLNNPTSEIRGGFIDTETNKLIVVTGPHLEESGELPDGQSYTSSVMAVDLSTGDRSVISGLKIDVANGNKVIGTGPVPDEAHHVVKGSDGKYYLKASNRMLLSIDPSTGNRTLVKQLPDPNNFTDEETPCARANKQLGFAMDDEGNFFVPYKVPGGAGIIKIDPNQEPCTYLTAVNDPDSDAGSGVSLPDNATNLVFRDGFLYGGVFLGQMVIKVAANGNDAGKRSLISSVERDVGSGARCHATEGFTMTDNGFVLAGSTSNCPYGPSVIRVSLEGDRKAPESGVGWENPPAEVQRVYAIPGSDDVFLGASKSNIVIIDWEKKKASNFSNNK